MIYIKNILFWINKGVVTLAGKDPRLTISAVSFIHKYRFLERLINALYRDKYHCRDAAWGWVDGVTRLPTDWGRRHDRSVWRNLRDI